MKIFISADIEGTNGIADWSEADKKNGAEYKYFADKMTTEVAAVCDGVNDFDPESEILVKDAHATARNIDHSKLPHNVRLNRGWPGEPASMVNCLDRTFDASVFTGYHSPAYSAGNPLAHTINSRKIAKMTINGKIASEFLMNYYASLSLGVPVIMVCGDKHLTDLVKEINPDIVTVATLEGFGNSTTSAHPQKTLHDLRSGAKEAASKAAGLKAAAGRSLPPNFEIQITYKQIEAAFRASLFPGVYAIDDMSAGYKCTNFFDFLKAWMFI